MFIARVLLIAVLFLLTSGVPALAEDTTQIDQVFSSIKRARLPDRSQLLKDFISDLVNSAILPRELRPKFLRQLIASNPQPLIWMTQQKDLEQFASQAGLKLDGLDKHTKLNKHFIDNLGTLQATPGFKVFSNWLSNEVMLFNYEERLKYTDKIPDEALHEIGDFVQKAVNEVDISKMESVELLNSDEGFRFGDNRGRAEEIALFKQMFAEYFRQLPLENKANIITALLELPGDASAAQRLSAVLQNIGVVMQKLFQFMGQQIESQELKEAAKLLLESVRPFDSRLAMRAIERELGQPIDKLFATFFDKPIKAATTGQIHVASLKSTGEWVVVKVLRPGLKKKVVQEFALLEKISKSTPFEGQVQELGKSIFEELDYTREAAAIAEAQIYNRDKDNLVTVQLSEDFKPTSEVLVLKMAPGKSLASLTPDQLKAKGDVLRRVLTRWLEVSLFETGFFNGDMHGGNIYVDLTQKPLPKITLLDFGNVGKLSVSQRRGFVRLAIGVLKNSSADIVKAFQDICILNEAEVKRLMAELQKFRFNQKDLLYNLNNIFSIAVRQKIKVPANMIQFNRGLLFLDRELRFLNQEMSARDPSGERFERVDLGRIYLNTIVQKTLKDIGKSMISAQHRHESILTFSMLKEIVTASGQRIMSFFKESCRNMFSVRGQ